MSVEDDECINVAIITARGGSKGLPRKNVLPVAGKPLISWTIEAALGAWCIDCVYVTTDDKEIKDISLRSGAVVIDRPACLALDESSSESALDHALTYLKNINIKTVILLQPTSPMRKSHHINQAFGIYKAKHASLVISVFEPRYHPAKSYVMDASGTINPLFADRYPYKRRQDLPKVYQPNGAVYIFDKSEFLGVKGFPKHNVYPYVMDEEDSLDIDTQMDLDKFSKKARGEK